MLNVFWLLLGVALIIFSANWLTDGAASIARKWGISDMIIGLTVVAFGTSAPELSISIISALKGAAPMAIGNVVGSNIFNILVIIGVVAMIRPVKILPSVMVNDIGLVVLSALALLAIGCSDLWSNADSRVVSRTDGFLLLLFLVVFMRYTLSQAKSSAPNDPVADNADLKPSFPMWRSVLMVVAGLAGLVFGGDRFVAGASGVALSLGMSEAMVGLTIVAAGTSLPELAASVAAALKGNPGIAVGNVIGSNIFNIFLVLASAAAITPLPFGGVSHLDLCVMMIASLLFFFFSWKIGKSVITRGEGAALAFLYVAYISFQIFLLA